MEGEVCHVAVDADVEVKGKVDVELELELGLGVELTWGVSRERVELGFAGEFDKNET